MTRVERDNFIMHLQNRKMHLENGLGTVVSHIECDTAEDKEGLKRDKNIIIGALRAITTIIDELENDNIVGVKIEQND